MMPPKGAPPTAKTTTSRAKSSPILFVLFVVGSGVLLFAVERIVVVTVFGPTGLGSWLRAYDDVAASAAYNGKIAAELFYRNSGGVSDRRYATALEELTDWDRMTANDQSTTFMLKTTGCALGLHLHYRQFPGQIHGLLCGQQRRG